MHHCLSLVSSVGLPKVWVGGSLKSPLTPPPPWLKKKLWPVCAFARAYSSVLLMHLFCYWYYNQFAMGCVLEANAKKGHSPKQSGLCWVEGK